MKGVFGSILHKNVFYGYSLEPPRRGGSMANHNIIFLNCKNMWILIRIALTRQFYRYPQHCFKACCKYLLELPRKGSSNEYLQHTFFKWRNKITKYSSYM